jgi:hypothetical protein
MARNYTVAISKAYFPKSFWTTVGLGPFDEHAEVVGVRASSRTEAAEKAWARHGKRWRRHMHKPASKLIVCLHVNDPDAGRGGLASRLHPVKVYEEESMAFNPDVIISEFADGDETLRVLDYGEPVPYRRIAKDFDLDPHEHGNSWELFKSVENNRRYILRTVII